jgi:hypothetical protein
MAIRVDRNRNISEEAVLSGAIIVSNAVSTILLPPNSERIYVAIFSQNFDIWLKFQAASIDNDKKGIFIEKGQTYEFPADTLYTGEISAISNLVAANVYTTELI